MKANLIRILIVGAAGVVAVPTMAQLPHTFSPGAPATANEVNANFAYVEQRISELGSRGPENGVSFSVDCVDNPNALNELLVNGGQYWGYESTVVSFTGNCQMPRGRVDEPGKEFYLIGSGASTSNLTGGFRLTNQSFLRISDTTLNAGSLIFEDGAKGALANVAANDVSINTSRNATLRMSGVSLSNSAGGFALSIDENSVARLEDVSVTNGNVQVSGSSALWANNLLVDGFLSGMFNAHIRLDGNTVVGEAEGGSAVLLIAGSQLIANGPSLTLNGGVGLNEVSTFQSTTSTRVNAGTVFIDTNSHFQMAGGRLEITKGTDDLGRGLELDRGSSLQLWGASLTFSGFAAGDQTLNLKNGTSTELRGGAPVRSSIPSIGIYEGAAARLIEIDTNSVNILHNSYVELNNTNIARGLFIRNSDLELNDVTVGNDGIRLESSSLSVRGQTQPSPQSIACGGTSVVAIDGYSFDGSEGGGCLDPAAWGRVLQSAYP